MNDFETKPISRDDIRKLSTVFREIFEVPLIGKFPVLMVLDKITDIFDNTYYEIVDDKILPANVMACCEENEEGGYTIKIKNYIYEGAHKNNSSACLGFICHEICHVFMFSIGYKPVFNRDFSNKPIPAYKSVEWQAKALCSEVMIPYEESKGMTIEEIVENYSVSYGFAKYRKRL